jgi:hypothetical protein
MYSKIKNPETGRIVKVNSLLGKRIINNYIQSGGIKIAKALTAALRVQGALEEPVRARPGPAPGTFDYPGRAETAVVAVNAQEKNWDDTRAANRRFHQPLAYPTELDMVPQHDPAAASNYGTGNKYYSASTSVDDESVNNWRGGPTEDTSVQARVPSHEELNLDWSVLNLTSSYAKSLREAGYGPPGYEQDPAKIEQFWKRVDEAGRRPEPDRAPRGDLSWESLARLTAAAAAYFTR